MSIKQRGRMNEKVEKPIMDGIAADARHGIGCVRKQQCIRK
ncbi:hypothetical protein EMIT013CA1_80193 [Bacillus sp. IT-13CA1]